MPQKKKKNGVKPPKTKTIEAVPSKSSGPSVLAYCAVALVALAIGVLNHSGAHPLDVIQTATSRLLKQDEAKKDETVAKTDATTATPNYALCNDEALKDFLHKGPVDGLHVACVEKGANGLWTMNFFPNAKNRTNIETLDIGSAKLTWPDLKQHLQSALNLRNADDLHQPWAIFTPFGERIVAEDEALQNPQESKRVADEIAESGMILVFEGGQWLWPGVKEGFKRTVDLYSIMPGDVPEGLPMEKRTATLETLSLEPLVLAVEGFLTEEECQHIQKKAQPTMSYSGVVLMDKDKDRPASDFRTSQSTFMQASDEILRDIDYRTASLVRIPRSHQEHVQVLRYGYTEKYNAHHDYFNPELYQNDPNTLRTIQNGKRNRLATVFWYLSDVPKGGETLFPRHNGLPQPMNLADCSVGLKVKPQTGKVIIFYSLTPGGTRDELSLHTACPVEEGIKWAANKWVWNLPMRYIRDA